MEVIQNLIGTLSKMQWSDYVDIALVAYLIYMLLPLIRTPSIMRIARVVVAIVLLTWLTNELHINTLSWILNQVLAVGLIAFVILFQPELRRLVDHLSNMQLKNLFSTSRPVEEMDLIITQIVRACEVMSREKVGALIVFAREQRLDEYFKTGTQIDGQVSEQLIRNIFFPKAALHDGAMIIRDNRVAAAGCVLPLSSSDRLSADLGTRHRAGVGMSENSDAVVVIVSEETGTISVAVGGMLKRHLAPQTLEKLLHNELCPEDEVDREKNPAVWLKHKIMQSAKEAENHDEK